MRGAAFDLRLGSLPTGDVAVVAFRGQEAISDVYRFDITVQTEADLLSSEPTLLSAPATLVMRVAEDDAPRAVSGIVSALASDGIQDHGKRGFRVRLVPRLWLLKKRKNTRIFQELSLIEIISLVLNQHGVPRLWSLSRAYAKRAYVVQYRETDYDFVRRLCSEAGIFFYFLGPPARLADLPAPVGDLAEKIVFCDGAQHYPAMVSGDIAPASVIPGADILPAPSLPFHPGEGALARVEAVHEMLYRSSIRPTSVALRDYDFERPLLDVAASVDVRERRGAAAEATELLAGAEAATPGPLEIYEHSSEHGEAEASNEQADTRLEQHRARALLARGRSSCRRLAAGHRFRLEGSPQPGVDGEYAVVRVRHEGHEAAAGGGGSGAAQGKRYENRFECVPATIPYRPRYPKRDLSQVLESAEVVGPAGKEVYTDKYGRIKVQFHWDREGSKNEHSSCWMRVMQAWAGTSWGFQFIPRVGMEVLVSFLGGDEDRPVVMGAVWNATHPPPFPLPLGGSKSGIITQSVGGAGSNELSFEDAAGGEQVYLKAQRDFKEQVLRNHALHVGGDQTITVANSQRVEVGGPRHESVAGAETLSVGGAQLVNVAGNLEQSVGGHKTETVAGLAITRSHGASTHVSGNHNETVEGYASVSVGSEQRETGLAVTVYGSESHDATKSMTLRSDTQLLFECGESSVLLTPETVSIHAKKIVIKAQEKLILLGDGPGIELHTEAEVLADKIALFSKGGSVELDAEAAHMDGPLVKLNCGAGETPEIENEAEKPRTKLFKWRCLDGDLEPYKNKTYRLITQGMKHKGVTDEDGVIEKEIPKDAFSVQITIWTEDFPEGERRTYTFRLGDLPPSSSVYGGQIRLRNLGYYSGEESDEINPDMESALMEFQQDHGLPMTCKLDGETIDKIDELHP